jgi:hypothetical protein
LVNNRVYSPEGCKSSVGGTDGKWANRSSVGLSLRPRRVGLFWGVLDLDLGVAFGGMDTFDDDRRRWYDVVIGTETANW